MCERCPERNTPNKDVCTCLCLNVFIGESFFGGKFEYCMTCNHNLSEIRMEES